MTNSIHSDLQKQVDALQNRVTELELDKADMEVMLEMTTDHADDLTDDLGQERDDLATVLELTTNHADEVETELHNKAAQLEKNNQFIRNTFGRFVSDDIVKQLLDSPEGLELGGEKRKVALLMSDLRGFTAISESLEPQQVMSYLNHYLDTMLDTILFYGGTIIEILGDGLLVVFGAPISHDNDTQRAVACALDMQLKMEAVNNLLKSKQLPNVEMGIGIHTGEVIVGNIGSKKRTKYGVVGSAVNLTGRIESYTVGNQVLLSESGYKEIADSLVIRQKMSVNPKGVASSINLFEVAAISGEFNLTLPQQEIDMIELTNPIEVRFTSMNGKMSERRRFKAKLVKLSATKAELVSKQPLSEFDNLKIQIRIYGEEVKGDVYAKVIKTKSIDSNIVTINFSSVNDAIKTIFSKILSNH